MIYKINKDLFYGFLFNNLIITSLVKINLIRDILNIIVKLFITSIFIISLRFFNL
jgi:hypothetical protein